ncbi:MAG: MgtC/SapB family protein [Nanoarchaeota archaeon]|nr:MgtC/SapB family protein [Nanoarchaeota archaeon]
MVIDIVDYEIFLRLLVAAIAGGIIGLERKASHKPAGTRTQMLISIGAALFIIITMSFDNADPARIIAGIVTGIGFLGAGAIFQSKDGVYGLTTAASIWTTAAIGISAGVGEYILTLVATLIVLLILQLNKINFFREL